MTRPGQPLGRRHPPQADEQLSSFLESGQLAAGTRRPVRRAPLSRRARAALWALRVVVIIVSAMVIYAFVAQLR